MSTELREAFHRAGDAVAPMGDAEQAVRSGRRRRRAATVAAPLAVLAVVGGVWFVAAGSPGEDQPPAADSSPSLVTAADLAGRAFVATEGQPEDTPLILVFDTTVLTVTTPSSRSTVDYRIGEGVLTLEAGTQVCGGPGCGSALLDLIYSRPTVSLTGAELTLSGPERTVTMTESDVAEADPVETDVRLFTGNWLLTGAAGTASLDLAPDGSLQLEFGCSSGSGQVTFLDSGTFTVEELFTEGGCSGVDTEFRTQQVLTGDVTYQIEGGTLTLTSAGGELVYQAPSIESAEGDTTLSGRTWVLQSIADGREFLALPEGVQSTLEFGDGALTVDYGCNTGSGDVTITDSTIEIGAFDTTLAQTRCPPPLIVEHAVEQILLDNGPITYVTEGDILTLTSGGGRLVYRATS